MVSVADPAQTRLALAARANDIPHATITLEEISALVKRSCARTGLWALAASVPPDLDFEELQWLHEVEVDVYVPPWRRAVKEPAGAHELFTAHRPAQIPDSCPSSPLILHEVACSDID